MCNLRARLCTATSGIHPTLVLLCLLSTALLRPVRILAAVAARLDDRNFKVRAGNLAGAARELETLGRIFVQSVSRLQARDLELETVHAKLADSEAHYRLLSANANDMITLLDSGFRRSYVSPACLAVTG